MMVWRVTLKREETFFTEYDDAHSYARTQLGHDNTFPIVDSVVILEKGWREKLTPTEGN